MAIQDEDTRQKVTEMRRAFYRQPDEFAERLAEVHRHLNPQQETEANPPKRNNNSRPGRR